MKKLILALILSTSAFAEVPTKAESVTYDFDCGGVEVSIIETDNYVGEVYTLISSAGSRQENISAAEGQKLLKDLKEACVDITGEGQPVEDFR